MRCSWPGRLRHGMMGCYGLPCLRCWVNDGLWVCQAAAARPNDHGQGAAGGCVPGLHAQWNTPGGKLWTVPPRTRVGKQHISLSTFPAERTVIGRYAHRGGGVF